MADSADYDERPTVLESAARDIVDEINRCIKLREVPQLRQIRWWGGHLAVALEAEKLIRQKASHDG